MASIGIDFGNWSSQAACFRDGGVEILEIEGKRQLPSFVAFTDRRRLVGEAAQRAAAKQLVNAAFDLKRALGRTMIQLQEEEKTRVSPKRNLVAHDNGDVRYRVHYLSQVKRLAPEQLVAALLTTIKQNASLALGDNPVQHGVISIPFFFDQLQRRKMEEAAMIAGWPDAVLLEETMAVAFDYCYHRKDLPTSTECPRHVVFVLFGQSNLQVALMGANQAGPWPLVQRHAEVGGRDFDERIAREFRKRMQSKVKGEPRNLHRLMAECEKLKRKMSADKAAIPFVLEGLVPHDDHAMETDENHEEEEEDFTDQMNRDEFESHCQDILETLKEKLQDVKRWMEEYQVPHLHSVELVGGASRIPVVKAVVKQVFGMDPMATLNAEETVARGCAIQSTKIPPQPRRAETLRPPPAGLTDSIEEIRVPVSLHQPWTLQFQFSQDACQGPLPARYAPDMSIAYDVDPGAAGATITVGARTKAGQAKLSFEKEENLGATSDPEGGRESYGLAKVAGKVVQKVGARVPDAVSSTVKQWAGMCGYASGVRSAQVVKVAVEISESPSVANPLESFLVQEREFVEQEERERERRDAKNSLDELLIKLRRRYKEESALWGPDESQTVDTLLKDTETWLETEGNQANKDGHEGRIVELQKLQNWMQGKVRQKPDAQRPNVSQSQGIDPLSQLGSIARVPVRLEGVDDRPSGNSSHHQHALRGHRSAQNVFKAPRQNSVPQVVGAPSRHVAHDQGKRRTLDGSQELVSQNPQKPKVNWPPKRSSYCKDDPV